MADHPEWEAWFANQDRWNGDYAYRGIYAAYLAAERHGGHAGDVRMTSEQDGSFLLSTNSYHPPLRLADEAACTAFASWLEHRCCGDRYPDMTAWEDQQHRWAVEDRDNWV